jgi:hypothetical protein
LISIYLFLLAIFLSLRGAGFSCEGNHRVNEARAPWINATSLLRASEVVQQAMLASDVCVDSVRETEDEKGATGLYLTGHSVSTGFGKKSLSDIIDTFFFFFYYL